MSLPYKLVALDVDGTLVEPGCGAARPAVRQAVDAVQAMGAKVVIASGRCHLAAIDQRVLGGIRPDYAVCAGGAQLVDAAGKELFARPFTPEQMYALVDFCENYDDELAFSYSDGYHVYIGFDSVYRHYGDMAEHAEFLHNGEDQDRHLQSMPCAGFCHMPPGRVAEFGRLYAHLGLRFIPFMRDWYDINHAGQTKADALAALLGQLNLAPGEVLAMGDGENDVEMLRLAGLGVAMGNAAPAAKAAADRVALDVRQDGAALLLDEVFGLGLGLAGQGTATDISGAACPAAAGGEATQTAAPGPAAPDAAPAAAKPADAPQTEGKP